MYVDVFLWMCVHIRYLWSILAINFFVYLTVEPGYLRVIYHTHIYTHILIHIHIHIHI